MPRPLPYPDFIYANCMIAKTKSGWSWQCLNCGLGGILGKKFYFRELAVEKAKDHRCEPPVLPPAS